MQGDAGDTSLIPELVRFPGEGNDNPIQYFFPENHMDRGAWQATIHGGSHFHFSKNFDFIYLSFIFGCIRFQLQRGGFSLVVVLRFQSVQAL